MVQENLESLPTEYHATDLRCLESLVLGPVTPVLFLILKPLSLILRLESSLPLLASIDSSTVTQRPRFTRT